MAANKPTHTVRTVSRRVSSGGANNFSNALNDDFSATPRTELAKKNLLRKMLIVFGVVIFLLVLLLAFDFLNEKNKAVAPAPSAPKTSTEIPAINLDKVDDLKNRLDAAQQEQQEQAEPQQPQQAAPAPQPQTPQQPDGVSPERTPFDDLNFVEEEPEPPEAAQDPNTPIVEQTVTETGETILRISPQRTRTAQTAQKPTQRQPISQRQQQIQQYQRAQQQVRVAQAERIEPENSANVPMQSRTDSGLPKATTARSTTRMPNNRFHVQAGIFIENNRARALYQRLVSAGIPTVLESRVQVGPFTTRREAEGARQQLKSMGIDSIVVAPSS